MNKKHLVFLGGEAGVGKSISAKEIQTYSDNMVIIDKDETTSVLANALLESYGQPRSDRESKIYLEKVKPLEYEQLDNIIWNFSESGSIIITAPFFDSFLDKRWIETMTAIADYQRMKVSFIFLTRDVESIRKGLVNRGAERDTWKIMHYPKYREQTNSIIDKILHKENVDIKHIHFEQNIDISLIVDYLNR